MNGRRQRDLSQALAAGRAALKVRFARPAG